MLLWSRFIKNFKLEYESIKIEICLIIGANLRQMSGFTADFPANTQYCRTFGKIKGGDH